jgi:hypothetical protein
MGFWRRGEPLHERLAREGGLVERPPHDSRPRWGEVGIHGIHRQREWDTVASAEAPGLPGEELRFCALPDGTLVVDEDVPDGVLTPLAEAIEATVEPPYRAEAVRRGELVWAVAARRIEVRELPGNIADELELVEDGQVTIGRRLDGDLFEIDVTPL